MVTRFAADDSATYGELLAFLTEHHGRQIFSTDGSTIEDQLIATLDGRLIATAESCTGGLIAARLTDRPRVLRLRHGRRRVVLQRCEVRSDRRPPPN